MSLIKHPARDACLYMGEKGAPPAPPDPQNHLTIASQPLGVDFSNLAYVFSSPGEIFSICCSDISTNQ